MAVEKVYKETFCRCVQSVIHVEQSMIHFLRQAVIFMTMQEAQEISEHVYGFINGVNELQKYVNQKYILLSQYMNEEDILRLFDDTDVEKMNILSYIESLKKLSELHRLDDYVQFEMTIAELLCKKRIALFKQYASINNIHTIWLNPLVYHVCMFRQ